MEEKKKWEFVHLGSRNGETFRAFDAQGEGPFHPGPPQFGVLLLVCNNEQPTSLIFFVFCIFGIGLNPTLHAPYGVHSSSLYTEHQVR